jgi:dCMP deaminase
VDVFQWIEYGTNHGWVTEACATHDGIPATPEEDAEWAEGYDPCQHVLRLWEDKVLGVPGADESVREIEDEMRLATKDYLVIKKDKQWLEMCEAGAGIFSTCAKAQFMCIIVDKHGRVIGLGYNGVPSGMTHCADGGCPRFLNDVPSGTPYDYGDGLCFSGHAEQNALAHADSSRYEGATLYVNGRPCLTCAKIIACSGIRRVAIFIEDQERLHTDVMKNFIETAGVELIEISRD